MLILEVGWKLFRNFMFYFCISAGSLKLFQNKELQISYKNYFMQILILKYILY